MSEQIIISATAEHGGMYRVFVDGVQISQHVQEREASESAVNALLQNLDAEVYYDHAGYKVMIRPMGLGAYSGGGVRSVTTTILSTGSPTAGGITATPGDGQVSLSSAAASGGTSPYSYQWQFSTTSGSGFTNIAGAAALTYTHTGRTNGVTYYYRMVVTDDASQTANSTQASATPSTVTAFFEDDFETGDKTHTEGGFSWTSASANVTVVSTAPVYEGAYVMSFRHNAKPDGQDSTTEQRFSLGANYTEIWFEYQLYVPSNYYHRDSSGADNNKFFRIHASDTDFHITTELERNATPGTSSMKRFVAGTRGASGPTYNGGPTVSATVPDVVGAGMMIEPGEWTRMRFHFRSATARDVKDGVAEWYANDTVIRQDVYDWWANDGADNGDPGQPAYVDGGYVLGWANSGYTEETDFRIDNFKVYSTDPGWGV